MGKLINANRIKKDRTTYTRPEGAGNFDNMDDKNIVDQINIKIGTCDLTPTDAKHIVNKQYVDDIVSGAIKNLDGGNSTDTFIAVGMSPIDGGDST